MAQFYTYGQLEAICLTGRRRHRVNWFGKLILQVELKHPKAASHFRAPKPGPYDPWENGFFTFWRDARTFDLPELIEAPTTMPVYASREAE